MSKPTKVRYNQTLGEEIANSVSHGVACLGALAITPIMIIKSIPYGAIAIVGVSVFGATLILLYLSSTLYHAFPENRTKRLFNIFDHAAIYLLIAGTYTPFTLGVLRGAWGYTLLGIVWSFAILGVVLKSIKGAKSNWLSTALYVAMGWLIVIAAKPLWDNTPHQGIVWLASGGVMYTFGVVFFTAERIRYHHFIWHLFVMGGSACHIVAVLGYAHLGKTAVL